MTGIDRGYWWVLAAYLGAAALFLASALVTFFAGYLVLFCVSCFLLGVVTGTGRVNLRRMRRARRG